eukprot:674613-Alexandrium_andersonii.AAC.1
MWTLAFSSRPRTSSLLMRRRLMFWLREHQSAQGGLPMSMDGRRAPSNRMARSLSPGLLKPHELPSGPGR